ncbi:MAG: membrane dipeptidase [Hyphomicrobiales bacterium]|nr:membrane dipeptidase [Hyphomicrobiales bacterium]
MTNPVTPLIFDGHNDLIFTLFGDGSNPDPQPFFDGTDGHVDARRCKEGGFGGGLFAVFLSVPIDMEEAFAKMAQPRYDLGLPEPIAWPEAIGMALTQTALLFRLEEMGGLKVCRTATEIEECLGNGTIAAVLHFEGAEAIDPEFAALEVFYQAGLRSLGPVWSRPSAFGHGVPFRYPSDGDTGPGLTEHGLELVRQCDRLGVMLDLSHLNEAGFWDVARLSTKPLVATHSNAHALCPHARNLTDKQLDAIRDSDGMVGVNFALSFLRQDGRMVDAGIDLIPRHLDYLIDKLGEDRVGLGSDFDGARIPSELESVAGLPNVRAAMRRHGFNDALMEKLCYRNWLGAIARIVG